VVELVSRLDGRSSSNWWAVTSACMKAALLEVLVLIPSMEHGWVDPASRKKECRAQRVGRSLLSSHLVEYTLPTGIRKHPTGPPKVVGTYIISIWHTYSLCCPSRPRAHKLPRGPLKLCFQDHGPAVTPATETRATRRDHHYCQSQLPGQYPYLSATVAISKRLLTRVNCRATTRNSCNCKAATFDYEAVSGTL